MIKVVQPAYQAGPKGGQGSFFPSGRRLLSCVRVFATGFRVSVGRRSVRWGLLSGWGVNYTQLDM